MLRRVDVEGAARDPTAEAFGCSRPTFYQAQAAFKARASPAWCRASGAPRGAQARRGGDGRCGRAAQRRPDPQTQALLDHVRRASASRSTPAASSARSGARKKTALRPAAGVAAEVPIAVLVTSYEALRRVALGRVGRRTGPGLGFSVLLRHGMPAWLRAWATVAHPARSRALDRAPLGEPTARAPRDRAGVGADGSCALGGHMDLPASDRTR